MKKAHPKGGNAGMAPALSSSRNASVVISAPMKSWICLFLVTAALTAHAAPRKAPAAKKASHALVQKAQRASAPVKKVSHAKPQRGVALASDKRRLATPPVQQAKASSLPTEEIRKTPDPTAALAGSAAAAGLAGASALTATVPPVETPVAAVEATAPRRTWQGLRESVTETASRMADKAHHAVDDATHNVADRTSDLVVHAMGFLGVPYRRGGNTVETGFDCSGFVRAMFQQTVGALLPRSAREQADATEVIDKQELRPGDLVFFNTMRRAFSHVGIYVGDGKFIHSPRSGSVVRVENMKESYWASRFNGARRVGEVDAAEMQAAITAKRY